MTFIGPPAAAMRKLGDKVQAKYLAEATGVPVAPWSGGPVEDMASALEHAKQIGYPMILKARSGGGGRGIRMVFDPSELEEAIERTQSEALKAFNDQVIFMEKLVVGGRHIEVQVIADNYGNAWAPGIRDCSDPAPQPEADRGVRFAGADPRSRTSSCAAARSRWSRRPVTAAPARWSSCTSPRRRCSPSSR